MLKSLNKNDVLVTPYSAVKEHHLSNVDNTDLILFEHTGSDGGPLAVAIDYIDFGDGSDSPYVNSNCSLANEEQSLDQADYREGLKIAGHFYETEIQNRDATYKRLVYDQTKEVFYNNYRDPTKMWGMEEIDFDKSQTKKFLQDKFVVLDIPTMVIGEKIQPNSVVLDDRTSDDNYTIADDGHCNLFIGNNLFSKHQELGDFVNDLADGHSNLCDNYFTIDVPVGSTILTAIQVGLEETASLTWNYDFADVDGFIFSRSVDNGVTWPYGFIVTTGSSRQTYDTTVTYGNTYWYVTKPYNRYGVGNLSNIASVYIESLMIVRNPQNTSGDISSSVSFSVAAVGATPIYYQWESGSTLLSDGARITGSYTSSVFTSSLIINSLTLPDSGSYRALVWNSYQGLTSSYANLSVNLYPPTVSAPVDVTANLTDGFPIIITHPVNQLAIFASTASFTVSASGDAPLQYFWQLGNTWLRDSSRIVGSDSASIRITNVQYSDSGSYRVLVSNGSGYVYSNVASMSVFNDWGEDFESYPTGAFETSSTQIPVFGTDGTVRLGVLGIVAIEDTSDYTGTPSLDSGAGWDGPGVINNGTI